MDATPIRSSINVFATTLVVSPFSIICGVLVKVTNKYRPLNYVGWALSMIGCGLLTLLKADSHTSAWAGFQIVAAMGIGIVVRVFSQHLGCPSHHVHPQWASTVFPILAPLPVTRAAPALAFYNFNRVFAQVSRASLLISYLPHTDTFARIARHGV